MKRKRALCLPSHEPPTIPSHTLIISTLFCHCSSPWLVCCRSPVRACTPIPLYRTLFPQLYRIFKSQTFFYAFTGLHFSSLFISPFFHPISRFSLLILTASINLATFPRLSVPIWGFSFSLRSHQSMFYCLKFVWISVYIYIVQKKKYSIQSLHLVKVAQILRFLKPREFVGFLSLRQRKKKRLNKASVVPSVVSTPPNQREPPQSLIRPT